MRRILPLVEGDGDAQAVPLLVRRLAHERQQFDVQVLPARKHGDLPKIRSNFERFYNAALLEGCPVLWVMDYDCESCDNVQRELDELRSRAVQVGMRQPTEFAFIVKEYEALFLADHETTREFFGDIPSNLTFPEAETKRGAKEWLKRARPKGLSYKEATDQAKLTNRLDLTRLRERSPSFRRFEAAVIKLLS